LLRTCCWSFPSLHCHPYSLRCDCCSWHTQIKLVSCPKRRILHMCKQALALCTLNGERPKPVSFMNTSCVLLSSPVPRCRLCLPCTGKGSWSGCCNSTRSVFLQSHLLLLLLNMDAGGPPPLHTYLPPSSDPHRSPITQLGSHDCPQNLRQRL